MSFSAKPPRACPELVEGDAVNRKGAQIVIEYQKSMVHLRLATSTDVPALRELAIQTQVDTFGAFNSEANMNAYLQQAYSLENLTRELEEPGSRNYLAFLGERLAGFMRLRTNSEVEHLLGPNTIELQRLYVDTSLKGQGIGGVMMQEAIDYAKSRGFDWIWLGVWERNFAARKFYEKWGFERFSEHVFQMGDDPQTDWLLRRKC